MASEITAAPSVEENQQIIEVHITEKMASGDEDEATGGCSIMRFMELGLGRGVDVTDPTPWRHKAIYQVRTVTGKNTVETEEGGGERRFRREVRSASETHGKINAFVNDPSAVPSHSNLMDLVVAVNLVAAINLMVTRNLMPS